MSSDRCETYKFARIDPKISEGFWTAYECGNQESEFYRALLNVTENGNKLYKISWHGCNHYERTETKGA